MIQLINDLMQCWVGDFDSWGGFDSWVGLVGAA